MGKVEFSSSCVGVYEYANGNKYTGDLVGNAKHGKGKR